MKRLNYTIVFVNDMARSVSFYRDMLGLTLKFESPHWTEFATEGYTLALHPADSPAAPGSEAVGNAAGTCQPGFQVEDLDDFHQRMEDAGVVCLQSPHDPGFGVRLAKYADPDGLAVGMSEQGK